MSTRFDTDDLLDCYRRGVFPMADSREDMRLFLMDPDLRGVLPLSPFKVPKRLRKTVRQAPYKVTTDTAFTRVMEACAESVPNRPATWINEPILNLYSALHRKGYAHSVECWNSAGELVGGLYGVALSGAFFGESMFTRATDASKIALVHLAARLKVGGYTLLDAQFHNPHLEQFGLIELPREQFREELKSALSIEGNFYSLEETLSGADTLQAITQIS